jgi:hypothetical protein
LREDQTAGDVEVRAAIEALSPSDLRTLQGAAKFRIAGLGRKALGRDWSDLLQEAVTRTVEGDRRWNKSGVGFVGHLLGVMRSIASHWAEHFRESEPQLETDLTPTNDTGESPSPLEDPKLTPPTPEEILREKQLTHQIETRFKDDERGRRVIRRMLLEKDAVQIRNELGMDIKQYETTVKRVRRGIEKLLDQAKTNG